ncbi:MAG: acyl-CoA thioesterase [Acidimicrobiia bacterium]|nr:acyl-CoA thioesterase [Acidimicrobiia bacterium]MDH3397519.1 acyl-CoA thioesterase [Acidimicrobiia bacterium]
MNPKTPFESLTTMAQVMQITDANTAGFVHGGSIMKLVDSAAGVAAMRHAQRRVVTAQVDSLTFHAPVHIGDVLSLTACVTQAWKTSMEIEVTVYREDPVTGEKDHTTTAYLTMVGLDERGRPVAVPGVAPGTDEEARRQREAETRRKARIQLRQDLENE